MFISEKGMARVLEHRHVKYHSTATCIRLLQHGATASVVSDIDIAANPEYLQPCQLCNPNALPKKIKPPKGTAALPPTIYPRAVPVVLWECSDGREFTGEEAEKEALWYELELTKKRQADRRPSR